MQRSSVFSDPYNDLHKVWVKSSGIVEPSLTSNPDGGIILGGKRMAFFEQCDNFVLTEALRFQVVVFYQHYLTLRIINVDFG